MAVKGFDANTSPGGTKVTVVKKKTTKVPGVSDSAASSTAKVGAKTASVNPNPTSSNITQAPGYGQSTMSAASTAPATNPYHDDSSQYTGRDKMRGFAGRYTPGSGQTLYDNPSIVGNDVLMDMGLGSNSALQGMYADVAANAPALAQLYAAINGDASQNQDEAIINTMADYLSSMATVGGNAPNVEYLLNALLNPAAGGYLDKYLDPVSADGSRSTAEQQLGYLQPYFQAATQGMSPLAQRAYQSALNQGLKDFNTQAVHGQNMEGTSFVDFLRMNNYVPGLG